MLNNFARETSGPCGDCSDYGVKPGASLGTVVFVPVNTESPPLLQGIFST